MDKKGQLNLETIGKTTIVILTLVILSISALLILTIMSSDSVIDQSSLSTTVANENGHVNVTGYTLSTSTIRGFASPTITLVTNRTSGATIAAGNYTVSSVGVVTNASSAQWNLVNITYTYNYNSLTANNVNEIAGNVSSGNVTFFTNIPTIFTILGIVLIISVIGLLVVVVRKLKERESISGI